MNISKSFTQSYPNKFNNNREQATRIVRRNIVDYLWKSVNFEGFNTTFPDTYCVFKGLVGSKLKVQEILIINNLKNAWSFLLDTLDYPVDLKLICEYNRIVGSDNLVHNAGFLRVLPVKIGGTSWTPSTPEEQALVGRLKEALSSNSNVTTKAINIMLIIMRAQMFLDGNKRTAMMIANHLLVSEGAGVLSIPLEHQVEFKKLLIKFYETNDQQEIFDFTYTNCIDGIDFSK